MDAEQEQAHDGNGVECAKPDGGFWKYQIAARRDQQSGKDNFEDAVSLFA